jgi:hypothetical protein
MDERPTVTVSLVAFAADLLAPDQIGQRQRGLESAGIALVALLAVLGGLERVHVQQPQAGLADGDGVAVDHIGGAGPSLSEGREREEGKEQ